MSGKRADKMNLVCHFHSDLKSCSIKEHTWPNLSAKNWEGRVKQISRGAKVVLEHSAGLAPKPVLWTRNQNIFTQAELQNMNAWRQDCNLEVTIDASLKYRLSCWCVSAELKVVKQSSSLLATAVHRLARHAVHVGGMWIISTSSLLACITSDCLHTTLKRFSCRFNLHHHIACENETVLSVRLWSQLFLWQKTIPNVLIRCHIHPHLKIIMWFMWLVQDESAYSSHLLCKTAILPF